MKTAIGIDIGGTKISVVAGTSTGRILAKKEIKTRTGTKSRDCVRELLDVVSEIRKKTKLEGRRCAGIGVAIPGAVDNSSGVIPRSPNLPGWKGIAIKKLLVSRFKTPVFLGNDANAAGLGELVFGIKKPLEHFIYITVSTGVGGGLITNGRLVEGVSSVGGEIGHMVVVPGGYLCGCGHRGCLEAYASGTAIAAEAVRELRKRKVKKLKGWKPGETVSAKLLAMAARQGDPLALNCFAKAGFFLGVGISNLLNILNPSHISIGGGVMKSAPSVFWRSMMMTCRDYAWPEALRSVKISRAKLKDKVGDKGALALVFSQRK